MNAPAAQTHSWPALKRMGWWKWPCLILLLFSLSMIWPYAERGGGAHRLSGQVEGAGWLNDCALAFAADPAETAWRFTARLEPACGSSLPRLRIALLSADGGVLANAAVNGGPNDLSGSLPRHSDAAMLAVFAGKEAGLAGIRLTWPLTDENVTRPGPGQ
ncbi:MAG: hypothetical protein Tsb0016_08040 [Sphingomonadales bacterium]